MFGRIFDTEAPFWQGVARVGDLVLLNLLLIASSIPLVTFGAAMTALYDTLWRLHDGQGGGTTALYLRSFRANLGRATLLWAIAAPIIGGLAASWALLPVADLLVAKVLVSVVVALVFPFPWFLQARFENPVGATLKNALLIPLVRLPYALGAFGVAAGIVALASRSGAETVSDHLEDKRLNAVVGRGIIQLKKSQRGRVAGAIANGHLACAGGNLGRIVQVADVGVVLAGNGGPVLLQGRTHGISVRIVQPLAKQHGFGPGRFGAGHFFQILHGVWLAVHGGRIEQQHAA